MLCVTQRPFHQITFPYLFSSHIQEEKDTEKQAFNADLVLFGFFVVAFLHLLIFPLLPVHNSQPCVAAGCFANQKK